MELEHFMLTEISQMQEDNIDHLEEKTRTEVIRGQEVERVGNIVKERKMIPKVQGSHSNVI